MGAGFRSIERCNRSATLVLFDACVLIDAIRRDPDTLDHLLRVEPPLRAVATTTLLEVAFAHKGLAPATLRENQRWIVDHRLERVPFDAKVARQIERSVHSEASSIRGRASLGDFLLASTLRAMVPPPGGVALATRNARDFMHLPIVLVTEFCPPGVAERRSPL